MEKRFIAAFALSILILLGWQVVSKKFMPQETPPVTGGTPASGAAPSAAPGAPAASGAPAAASQVAPPEGAPAPASSPSSAAVGASVEQEVHLDTDLAEIVLTNKGGRVRSWRLKTFESAGRPVDFVSVAALREDQLPVSLVFDDRQILPGINAALFEMSRTEESKGATRVSFHWSDGAGSEVKKTFEFRAAEPIVGLEVETIDRGRAVTPRVTWGPGLEVEDPKGRSNTYYNGYALTYDGTLVTHYKKQNISQPISIPETAHLAWAGLDDQYFTALVLPTGATTATIAPFSSSALATPGKSVPADISASPVIAIALPDGKAQLFVGPKNSDLLRSVGHGVEKAIWFSSYQLIYFCAKPIFLALRFVHDHWVPNYGVAIILLTLGLRIALFPLNQFSMVKMRKVAGEMQRVQPKVKAIQAKYKKSKDPDARAKMNTETMELYKREGVNPFGSVSGCLPLFIQMPILWAFYDVLTATVELRGAPFFGWIHDLTHPDAFYVTPILMGASMFVQQKMTPTANVDPQQQRVMLLMPVFFTWVFTSLPSGLVLYYFVNNLLGIGQQWLVNRHIARLEAAPTKA
jgi:YidC/Oxa1 family membrane protein insertase